MTRRGLFVAIAALVLTAILFSVWESSAGLRAPLLDALQAQGATVYRPGLMSGKDCRGSDDPLCSNFANTAVIYLGAIVPCAGECAAISERPIGILDSALTWQIAEHEALVLFGPPPPSTTHFGIQVTAYERHKAHIPRLAGYRRLQPGEKIPPASAPDRYVVDAAIGDTFNNHTLNSAPDPFNEGSELFALIISANRNVETRVRQALNAAGVTDAAINTLALPGDHVFVGNDIPDREADSFRMVGRIARPFEEAAVKRYLRPGTLKLWRVAYEKNSVPAAPFAVAEQRSRYSGRAELNGRAGREFLQFQKHVKHRFGEPDRMIHSSARQYDDRHCIETGSYCWGNNNDALYVDINAPGSEQLAKFDLSGPGSRVIILGVDHQRLRYADFWNFAWFDPESGASLGSFDFTDIQRRRFELPADASVGNSAYFIQLRRRCGAEDAHCLSLSDRGDAVPEFNLVNRIYVNPQTGTGPAAEELVLPVVFVYD